jgi:hypothetical protein
MVWDPVKHLKADAIEARQITTKWFLAYFFSLLTSFWWNRFDWFCEPYLGLDNQEIGDIFMENGKI